MPVQDYSNLNERPDPKRVRQPVMNLPMRYSRVCLGIAAATVLCASAGHAAARAQAPVASVQEQDDIRTQDSDPMAAFAAPLLREGSHLMEARARLRLNRDSNQWELVLDPQEGAAAGVAMAALPCTRLAEMQRIVESTPRQRLVFMVNGAVYVYRDRNFILPTHAAVIVEDDDEAGAGQPEPTADGPSTQPRDAAGSKSSAFDDSAEAIARRLRERSGAVVRSAAPRSERDDVRPDDARARRGSRHDRPAAALAGEASGEKVLPEGTTLMQRRGRISRDAGGGWMFIFDADASGLADPPMTLLPCMLLERIEAYARRLGGTAPALISGHVYAHEGRNYLMPIMFRVPQERRNLTP